MSNLKKIIYAFLGVIGFVVINSNRALGQIYYLDSGKPVSVEKNEAGEFKIFDSPKWRYTINPAESKDSHIYNDSAWKEGKIMDVVDSLLKVPDWNRYLCMQLKIKLDQTYNENLWWIKVFSLSPMQVFVNGKLIVNNGLPSDNEKTEKNPNFTKTKPLFNEIGTLLPNKQYTITIKWSGHQAVRLTKTFPGTFKENGPILTLTDVNPWPKFTNEVGNIYARVYISSGLLLLVIIIQLYFFILLKRKINLGIAIVAILLLIHLFLSHIKFIDYSILNIALDTVMFYPLFISIFSLFPWIASRLLNVNLGFNLKMVIQYVIITVSIGILLFAYFGKNSYISFTYIFLTLLHSFIWLIIITYKSHSQKSPYATIIILAYFLPISIIIFSFLFEISTQVLNLKIPEMFNAAIFSNTLIITFYIALPVLTTIQIARQNTDLLSNLSKQVEDQTYELKLSLENFKTAQRQLIQSEKMASLGELTAGIAHEIQNPLNFVNNFSEVSKELIEEMKEELATGSMQSAVELANNISQNLEKINHHGKRADTIVKSMLAHSRTSSGKKELTNLNVLAEEYLKLSYHGIKAKNKQFNASFKFEPDHNLPQISVVPQDIGRVLLNLINNAFYAVYERSKLNEPGYFPQVTLTTLSAEKAITIVVHDNGNGIPEEIKEKIFQPFFTTKPTGEGTGLGLSLSYDIVKAHGGELIVESQENFGTIFNILLPK